MPHMKQYIWLSQVEVDDSPADECWSDLFLLTGLVFELPCVLVISELFSSPLVVIVDRLVPNPESILANRELFL